jgi:4-azaleucine resistance transporter AzlC
MSEHRTAFRAGITAIAPLLLGLVPFGLIFGVAAQEAGIGPLAGVGMSAAVFAGAAQLAAIDLIGADATPAVIVLTVVVINARFLMYSASLAPHFAGVGWPTRIGLGYCLTDQAYAVSIIEFGRRETTLGERVAFYTAASIGMWTTWVTCTTAGIALGAGVPPEWSLDFAVPLVFLALLVPAISDRSTAVAAATAGAVATAAAGFPFNLGLMTGALAGIAAGVAALRSSPARGGTP